MSAETQDVFLILATYLGGPLPIKRVTGDELSLVVIWTKEPTREQLDAAISAAAAVQRRTTVTTAQAENGLPALSHFWPSRKP